MGTHRSVVGGWVCVLGALALLAACSSGGGGGGTTGPATTDLKITAGVPSANQDVAVAGGGSGTIAQVYTVPATLGAGLAVTDVSVNLNDTLDLPSSVFKARAKPGVPAGARGAAGDSVGQMTVWIGPSFLGTGVCGSPDAIMYGPVAITETAGGGAAADPPTVQATLPTVNVINTGSAAICVQIDADQDIDAHFEEVAMDVTTCDDAATFIGGEWEGTYTCRNSGGCADESGDVFIFLGQDTGSHSATYTDDGGGSFSGEVCGNEFRFDGGYGSPVLFVQEGGTFTVTGPGQARKHSEWHDVPPGTCGGVCDDVLHQTASF